MRNRFALPLGAAVAAALWACSSGNNNSTDAGSSGSSSGSSGGSVSSGSSSSGAGSSSGSTSSGGSSSSSGSSSGSGACSSDGGASVTSVCGTMALKDLTAAETNQLCVDTFAYFGSNISASIFCHWEGLISAASSSPMSDSDVQTKCTTSQGTCEGSDAGTEAGADIPDYIVWGTQSVGTPISNCFQGAISSSCTATVAQYSSCISDESAAFISTVNGFPSCATLTLAKTTTVNTAEGAMPASCVTLASACAGLSPPDPLQF